MITCTHTGYVPSWMCLSCCAYVPPSPCASVCVRLSLSHLLCDLALMVFQSVGSHAELVSNCLDVLNSTCRRLLKGRRRRRRKRLLIFTWGLRSFPQFPPSLTPDILLKPPCAFLSVFSPVKFLPCIQQRALKASEIAESVAAHPSPSALSCSKSHTSRRIFFKDNMDNVTSNHVSAQSRK